MHRRTLTVSAIGLGCLGMAARRAYLEEKLAALAVTTADNVGRIDAELPPATATTAC